MLLLHSGFELREGLYFASLSQSVREDWCAALRYLLGVVQVISLGKGLRFSRSLPQGNVPSRESIQVYYQKQLRLNLSRESGLDRLDEDDSTSGSQRVWRRRAGYRMESQDSMASRDSMSRCVCGGGGLVTED